MTATHRRCGTPLWRSGFPSRGRLGHTAVLAGFLVALIAGCKTPSAETTKAGPAAAKPAVAKMAKPVQAAPPGGAAPAAEKKPEPPAQKMYAAKVSLLVPHAVGSKWDCDTVARFALLTPSSEIFGGLAEGDPERVREIVEWIRVGTSDWVDSNYRLDVLFWEPDPNRAVQVLKGITPRLQAVFDRRILEKHLEGRGFHDQLLDKGELEDLRKKQKEDDQTLLTKLARFGSYEYGITAFEKARARKDKAEKELRELTELVRNEEMSLAVEKAQAEALEQRLAKEAEAARKAETEDPISRELQTLVGIAERDYANGAKRHQSGLLSDEGLNQKEKLVAESRLALLRRKEELSKRAAGEGFGKLKEELIVKEPRLAGMEAKLREDRKRAEQLQAEAAKLSKALAEATPLYRQTSDLAQKLSMQDNMARDLSQLPKTTILEGPSLVGSGAEGGGGS